MGIAMIGTGYVGLVSAACFAEFGIDVVAVDKDQEKIEGLWEGKIPIYEPGLDDFRRCHIGDNQATHGDQDLRKALDHQNLHRAIEASTCCGLKSETSPKGKASERFHILIPAAHLVGRCA